MGEESLTTPLASGAPQTQPDVEMGEQEPRWAAWARETAERVRQQAAEAAEQAQKNLSQGLEKAQSVVGGRKSKAYKVTCHVALSVFQPPPLQQLHHFKTLSHKGSRGPNLWSGENRQSACNQECRAVS